MAVEQLPAQQFFGRVFMPESSDELGTYEQAWQDFTAAGYFDQLDELAETPNRTTLLVFSPFGTFQYWVGSVVPMDVTVPEGLQVLPLPAATGGQAEKPASRLTSAFPVEMNFNKGLEVIEKAGYPLPSHIGQTDHPYFLEQYPLNDNGEVEKVIYTLYINEDQLEGYDEVE
ncbi:hypothetical protein [Lacticaseibacillus brantae]|uniref:GyrI-like small molecule binding domain-containing protein n=1 Tax=Lacticaseibacillus brantae DSM 23927 TaxID=1423727 RepID=A0A0R2AZQ3_9LACO|nr:hypothetical protein [Lacticaseibacillus brantae]KRM72447.1 hypothetical protein FC34_GL000152 [Lacticaseibacillus brantae DSM 23927]